MQYFEIVQVLILVMLALESSAKKPYQQQQDDKKPVVINNKAYQVASFRDDNEEEEECEECEAGRQTLNVMATNIGTVTNLVKAQSEIIENLSNQVASATKGTGNEKKFKQVFEKIANQSLWLQNVTKELNETIKHLNKLTAVCTETKIQVSKDLKGLEDESEENEEEIEEIQDKIMAKVKKLEDEMKTLRDALNSARKQSYGSKQDWPEGSYCILANGRCPYGFQCHEGHLKSLYLYSSLPRFVNHAKFGSSSIDSYGNYRDGENGNFFGSLSLVTCCK